MHFTPLNTAQHSEAQFSRLLQLVSEVGTSISQVKQHMETNKEITESWLDALDLVRKEMQEEIFRVAVVGSVKAGKSTFANYMLGRDILNRGSGIITSIVTRVVHGGNLSATLTLKGLDEINSEVRRALLAVRDANTVNAKTPFRIQDTKARARLAHLLDKLNGNQFSLRETERKSFMLLRSYIEGYESVVKFLKDKAGTITFEGNDVFRHQEFTSQEKLSIFLKEIVLSVPGTIFPHSIEIGDCQGIDSPNPNHMKSVVDYLLESHLVVYLTSMRTGLRESDVKLINTLKTLRMTDRVMFVVNLDLGEIDSSGQLDQLMAGTKDQLSHFGIQSPVYAFSGLYCLLHDLEHNGPEGISPRDNKRLKFWQAERDFVEYSNTGREQFEHDFNCFIREKQQKFRMETAVSRLSHVVNSLNDYMKVRVAADTKKIVRAQGSYENLRTRRDEIRTTLELIHNSLQTVADSLKKRMKANVDNFFNHGKDNPVAGLLEFIEKFSLSPDYGDDSLNQKNIRAEICRFYQGLNEGLDRYINEKLNLGIIDLLFSMKTEIELEYKKQITAYLKLIRQNLNNYYIEMANFVEGLSPLEPEGFIKSISVPEIKLPLFSVTLNYEYGVRAQVMVLAALQKSVNGMKGFADRLLKQTQGGDELKFAIERGSKVVKNNVAEHLKEQFQDYKENLKYGYVCKLIDLMKDSFYKEIVRYVECSVVDLGDLLHTAEADYSKEVDNRDVLLQLKRETQVLNDSVERFRFAQ